MKTKKTFVFICCLLTAVIAVGISTISQRQHDPKDLWYWRRAGAGKDWSSAAAQGDAQAQFYVGLSFISTNLVTRIQRSSLAVIPVIGRRFFEKVSYGIDGRATPEQLEKAYVWINKSADQGFAPANEVKKLFIGRVGGASEIGVTDTPQ